MRISWRTVQHSKKAPKVLKDSIGSNPIYASAHVCSKLLGNNCIYQTELKPRCLKIGDSLERQALHISGSTE